MNLSPTARLTIDYPRDRCGIHSEVGSNFTVQFATANPLLNFCHLLSRQFCMRVIFAVWRTLLRCHVFHVGVVGAKEQVFGVATRRVVAAVKNVKSVWDWSVCQLVSHTVRAEHFVRRRFRSDTSIAPIWPMPHPLKASIASWFAQSSPKPLCKWRRGVNQAIVRFAFARAELSASASDFGRLDLEGRSAAFTGHVHTGAPANLSACPRAIFATAACNFRLDGLKGDSASCASTRNCRSYPRHCKSSLRFAVGPVLHCSKVLGKSEMVQPGNTAGLVKFPQRDYAVLYPGDEGGLK